MELELKIDDISRISESVRQVLHEQCDSTLALITAKAEKAPHETIHEIRKNFKKIRAVLRLVRDTTGRYHTENRFFRDEARKISDLRDATALIEALDLIEEQFKDKLYKNAFTDVRALLIAKMAEKVLQGNKVLQEIHENLRFKCQAMLELPLSIDGPTSISPGIKRTYKRGRKAYEKASISKLPEDFHEWRKRVKYLRYQLLAIAPVCPPLLTVWENELHKLSDFLGTDRDLYMLKEFLDKTGKKPDNENGYLLRTLVEGHRRELQEQALLLGKKIYHLKPGVVVSWIEAAWFVELSTNKRLLISRDQLES